MYIFSIRVPHGLIVVERVSEERAGVVGGRHVRLTKVQERRRLLVPTPSGQGSATPTTVPQGGVPTQEEGHHNGERTG